MESERIYVFTYIKNMKDKMRKHDSFVYRFKPSPGNSGTEEMWIALATAFSTKSLYVVSESFRWITPFREYKFSELNSEYFITSSHCTSSSPVSRLKCYANEFSLSYIKLTISPQFSPQVAEKPHVNTFITTII